MIPHILQTWPSNFAEAKRQQQEMAPYVQTEDRLKPVSVVAGVDVGFLDGGRIARAAVVYCDANSAEVIAYQVAQEPVRLPYVPGYLSFRELPAVLKAFDACTQLPDLIVCDGHGYAHPRRFGVACHLGVILDRPSFGVAKSRLIGEGEPPPPVRGKTTLLSHNGETIGATLCTRTGVKPVYVSVGHRIALTTAIGWTLALTRGFKLPEPTRWADRIASQRGARFATPSP